MLDREIRVQLSAESRADGAAGSIINRSGQVVSTSERTKALN